VLSPRERETGRDRERDSLPTENKIEIVTNTEKHLSVGLREQ
jgi:hypothetical protein